MKELTYENPLADPEEEIAFSIIGSRGGEEAIERFECLARAPFAATALLMEPSYSIAEYVRLCLKPEEEERFNQLLYDKDFQVEPQVLRDVHRGLIEHYSGRPTTGLEPSGAGPESIDDLSTGASSQQESLSAASQ